VRVTGTNGNTAASSVVINVTTRFSTWQTANFSASELTNAAVSGPGANPDGDKLPNLIEYATGLDPKAFNSDVPSFIVVDGIFTRSHPHFKAEAEVDLKVESSSDLMNWTIADPTEIIDNGPVETWVIRVNIANNATKYFRLKGTTVP